MAVIAKIKCLILTIMSVVDWFMDRAGIPLPNWSDQSYRARWEHQCQYCIYGHNIIIIDIMNFNVMEHLFLTRDRATSTVDSTSVSQLDINHLSYVHAQSLYYSRSVYNYASYCALYLLGGGGKYYWSHMYSEHQTWLAKVL